MLHAEHIITGFYDSTVISPLHEGPSDGHSGLGQ